MFVIAKCDCCNTLHRKIKLLAKSIDLKGEMEVSRKVSGLIEIQIMDVRSSVNKEYVYHIAAFWHLHE